MLKYPHAPTLTELITLARQAGEILRTSFGQQLQVDHKGVIDLVSEADRRSEQFLLSYIHQHFPADRIVAEESGEHSQASLTMPGISTRWTARSITCMGCPSIRSRLPMPKAVCLRLGVVYDPMRDECFSAEVGYRAPG